MTLKVPQGVIGKPKMIIRLDTKEVVKEHIQRDDEVLKKRMLQHPSSVSNIKEVIENEVQRDSKSLRDNDTPKHLGKIRMNKEEEVKDVI